MYVILKQRLIHMAITFLFGHRNDYIFLSDLWHL